MSGPCCLAPALPLLAPCASACPPPAHPAPYSRTPASPQQGKPSPLVSSFKLSYYTLLNLMKRPEAGTQDLETVIANSFQQFQRDRAAPKVRPPDLPPWPWQAAGAGCVAARAPQRGDARPP